MKLVKKLISAVAAVSMVASAFAAMTVSAATPTLTFTATPASDKSYIDLKISYSGFDGGVRAFGMDIFIDDDLFTLTDFEEMEWDMRDTIEEEDGGASTDLTKSFYKNITPSYANDYLNLKWNAAGTETMDSEMDNLLTFKIGVKDGVSSSVWTDGYTFSLLKNETKKTSFGTYNVDTGLAVNLASIPAAGGGDEPDDGTVDAEVGTVKTGTYENDYALAIWNEFAVEDLANNTGIYWTINGEKEYTQAAVEVPADFDGGNFKVGVIIAGADKTALDAITAATAKVLY